MGFPPYHCPICFNTEIIYSYPAKKPTCRTCGNQFSNFKPKFLNIFDLKAVEKVHLLTLAKKTLLDFPILKKVYSNSFLEKLVNNRFHFNNYLLWLLTSRQCFTYLTWKNISQNLSLLLDSEGLMHFKDKLKSDDENIFGSYITELDFAAYFKNRGFDIELEPLISKTGKNPEFKLESSNQRIFFEAKNIFQEELVEMTKKGTQIQGVLGKTKERYAFSIDYTLSLTFNDIPHLKKFVIGKLRAIQKSQTFPLRFNFPNNTNAKCRITVSGRTDSKLYGYLGCLGNAMYPIIGYMEIRKKLTKKTRQLPKGEKNVIIIQSGHPVITEDDVKDALYGHDELAKNKKGFFSTTKNTRISAIIFYVKKWNAIKSIFEKEIAVYHNPFANQAISPDFFADNDVRQFVLSKKSEVQKMSWL